MKKCKDCLCHNCKNNYHSCCDCDICENDDMTVFACNKYDEEEEGE